jgi:hypothetical protein
MEDRQVGVSSVAELMEEDDHKGKRALVQAAAAILIAVGLLFTGYMSFSLYSRAFPDTMKVLGLIPAVLIEGSLATFLLGSFVWFAHGTQGTLAKIFGWAMFAIVALNCVVEFNALVGSDAGNNDFLKLYSFWGVPLVIPLVVGFWKAVIDADPAIQIMRQKRKIQQTMQIGKMQSLMVALGEEESRAALTAYGQRNAREINARLRGNAQLSAHVPAQNDDDVPAMAEHVPARPARNGRKAGDDPKAEV